MTKDLQAPMGFDDLVIARKKCRICIDRNPGEIHAGSAFEFDPNVVSYWAQWLGHPQPNILIVGQDFGDIEYFKSNRGRDNPEHMETNDNLRKLLQHIGLFPTIPPCEDTQTRVFLTNSILCLKVPPMNRKLRTPWVRSCADAHLRPLISKLNPPIIVAMGGPGWLAVKHALDIKGASSKIGEAAGTVWTTTTGIKVFYNGPQNSDRAIS